MDVFDQVAAEHGAFFAGCCRKAWHALELHRALPGTTEQLAGTLSVSGARLDPLLRVLSHMGHLGRTGPTWTAAVIPDPYDAPDLGWGRLAEVIRSNRPLDGADEAAYQAHLRDAGRSAAAEVVTRFLGDSRTLLDAGGGTGIYSEAFLNAAPGREATLVDRAEVLALPTRCSLAGARALVGDLETVELGSGYDAALLSNVLHLHDRRTCETIVAAVVRAVRPGGVVLIKDFRPDTHVGALFAVNMALYTDGGDVWPVRDIETWLEAAGAVPISVSELRVSPNMLVLSARHQ